MQCTGISAVVITGDPFRSTARRSAERAGLCDGQAGRCRCRLIVCRAVPTVEAGSGLTGGGGRREGAGGGTAGAWGGLGGVLVRRRGGARSARVAAGGR